MFDFSKDPIENFEFLLNQAQESGFKEPIAMQLATTNLQLEPSVRTVLFKGMVRGGFSFYTNYESQKGKELSQNPKASLLFFWNTLEQQIRISGKVDRLTRPESENYFKTRPRISQLGSWASIQSDKLERYETLDQKFKSFEDQFKNKEVPCPPHWGGFHVVPMVMEFWFGKTGRLHERYVYQRSDINNPWQRFMKYP